MLPVHYDTGGKRCAITYVSTSYGLLRDLWETKWGGVTEKRHDGRRVESSSCPSSGILGTNINIYNFVLYYLVY